MRILDFFYLPIKLYYYFIFGKYYFNSDIKRLLKIDDGKNIFLGENVFIGYKSWLSAKPYSGSEKCQLIIEDGAVIGHFNHIVATKRIVIKKDALLASRVYVSDNIHDYSDPSKPIKMQQIIQKDEVVLGEGCWIGENVSIIGASVGKNSVVGANSVVTHSIPDYCVAVGIPAKVIKKYSFSTSTWENV
jgi:acetyltransferase-like isoleucine patch superfamily enzyme